MQLKRTMNISALSFLYSLCFCCQLFVSGWISKDCTMHDPASRVRLDQPPVDFSINVSQVTCGRAGTYQRELRDIAADLVGLRVEVFAVQKGAFSQFYNLKQLHLDIYKGTVIHAGAFHGLRNLESLTLEFRCRLDECVIEEDAFQGLDNLKELYMSGSTNPIGNVYMSTCIKSKCEVVCSMKKYDVPRDFNLEFKKLDSIRRNCTGTPGWALNSPLGGGRLVVSDLELSWNFFPTIDIRYLYNSTRLDLLKVDRSFFKVSELLESRIQTVTNFSLVNLLNITYFYRQMKSVCEAVSRFGVKHLTVAGNSLVIIYSQMFEKCDQLESLDLSYSLLVQMTPGFLYAMKKLRRLVLLNNLLNTINICPTNKTFIAPLSYLDYSKNNITGLKLGQFSCVAYLLYLSLANNKLQTIEKSAFLGLRSLRELNLAANRIQVIGENDFEHLNSLSTLTLLNNPIEVISAGAFKHLQLRDLSLTSAYDYFMFDLSQFRPGIRTLLLEAKSDIHILGKNASHISSLQNVYLYGIGRETVVISFEDCGAAPVTTLKELLVKKAFTECFDFGKSATIFASFVNLEKLYFQSPADSIKSLDISSLHNLRVLYLEDIYRITLAFPQKSELLFKNLTRLQCLILINSGFSYFTPLLFKDLTSLELLKIQQQKILILGFQMFQNSVNLKYIFFSNVIFQCTCQNAWIIPWAATKNTMLLNFKTEKCFSLYDQRSFVTFLEHTCDEPIGFIFFLLTTAFLLLFLMVTYVYKRLGWHIVYLKHILRAWLEKLVGGQSNKVHYKYDVFISYSQKDECWVFKELLPNLEQKGPSFLKLCLHNRDFEVGKDIVDNIVDSIYSSKKTVCVISRHYLRSEWCSLEMRMATYRLLAESQDLLILVFLERISPYEISAYHRLAKVIKKKTYIDWPETENEKQLFWLRLKDSIMKAKDLDCQI
ncbi:toll-like receptor 12 [Protopterus annectens]|uniref:toll-like receptor 12 n=1 Tax=Protopterus annectens TaxID=7888 RepID=UPI001CFC3213|nr:toll-like receptor 12 [Protopterus annectens]